VKGYIGPYHLDGSAGVAIDIHNLDMTLFADVEIGTGPLSCSLDQQ
jgi:hypothetical protein